MPTMVSTGLLCVESWPRVSKRWGTVILDDCSGGRGSPSYRPASVPAGPTPLVQCSLDHVHRIIASSTIIGSTTGSAERLPRVLRLPHESRRKSTTRRTRRRLLELHETHETAHTLHHLVALKVPKDLLTVPSIRL